MAENNYREGRTEIWSVESQYSLNSGVLVTVTGTLEIKVNVEVPETIAPV